MFRILKEKYPVEPHLETTDDGTKKDELIHLIRHPNDQRRPLFLSFDPCHLIKNIRNCFLDRQLHNNGRKIDFELIIALYTGSKKQLLRAFRGNFDLIDLN